MRIFQYLPILICLLALTPALHSQQVPFLNHYSWNPRLFNPASQGTDGNGEITAVYRSQFQSIEANDRPNTYLFHADFSPWMPKRIGLAAQVIGDKAHLISRFQFSSFFGYHLLQTNQLNFSLGASASFFSQNIDFDGLRLSDVLDLAVFQGQHSTSRFDGGPGLAFEYRIENGSFFALDMAANQVFTSDIRIDKPANATRNGALYDIVPHYLANARIYVQGNGFAVEPNVAFRALGGDKPLKAGVFDLNLNGYFLKNNRLMVGTGLRTNEGGMHFQVGLKPTQTLQLIASAELHNALGPTYEFGASYFFGKIDKVEPGAPPIGISNQENLLEGAYREIDHLATNLKVEFDLLQNKQQLADAAIQTSVSSSDRRQQMQDADSCTVRLVETGDQLERLRQQLQTINIKRLQAEQTVRSATNQGGMAPPGTQGMLKAIQEKSADVQGAFDALTKTQQTLRQQCEALRSETNIANCIERGDAECIQELFRADLATVTNRPANMFPLRIFALPGAAAMTYHFPNDEETYLLPNEQRTLANHLVEQLRQLENQGVALDKLALVSELQEDRGTLGYRLGLTYGGELGDSSIPYALVDNESGVADHQNLFVAPGSRVSLETLAALKLVAWQQFLVSQGLPADRISLEIRYNHSGNIYREETKVVVRVRR